MKRLPKILGADVELGNFLMGTSCDGDTGHSASRALLKQIDGIPGSVHWTPGDWNIQDVGRKWLVNGSCIYIDMDHLEICIPEVTSAWDFCAAFHAQLRLVRDARERASAALREGGSVHVNASNGDRNGSSWGGHLNVLVTRQCYDNIFKRRMQYLLWLASYQAASVVIHGQGKVGSENGAPHADYQISQRADFLEQVAGLLTTSQRPLVNSRDETLSGKDPDCARFHHIASDTTLCHSATVLRVGILQILLSMVECGAPEIRSTEILDDPVRACGDFSRDPDLRERQATLSGEEKTAVELLRSFYDASAAFVARGDAEGFVPRADEIMALWAQTLELLENRDWDRLSRQLDWVLKRRLLEEVMVETGLDWRSPELRRLDLAYASLDPEEGLYLALEAAGQVDLLVTENQIGRRMEYPPSDTRAYTRGNLLRVFGRKVLEVDWDRARIRSEPETGSYVCSRTLDLSNPAKFTRAETGRLFKSLRAGELTDNQLLRLVDPTDSGAATNHFSAGYYSTSDYGRRDHLSDGYTSWR